MFIGKMKSILSGVCENGIFQNFLFTKLMIDMPKVPDRMDACKFNFCARVAAPFINDNCSSGLELSVVNIFQSVMGFQVNFKIIFKRFSIRRSSSIVISGDNKAVL